MRNLLLLLFLLPVLSNAQHLTDKFIKGDSIVLTYDPERATECISTIAIYYHHIGWASATVTTKSDRDSITNIKCLAHISANGRVDSLNIKNSYGHYVSLSDVDAKFQGGYLSEYAHADNVILWTRIYFIQGNTTQEFAITMKFNSAYVEEQ